ncbi:MAG: antA/AntB antirepressor family protein, partial [Lacrimispora sphenoides]
MNEIIQINYESESPTVSARDLHDGLEIRTPYTMWFERMAEYGFEEGKDFFTKMLESTGGRPSTEHELSVDMAKQICMIQRTEKGRVYRQHFLDLEKAWNTPEQVFARALKMANQKIDELKTDKSILIEDVQRMKPKEIFADAVSASHTSILVRELAKLISQNGIDTGEKRLYK